MIEVVRMLNTHHGGVYRVYNLCSEKTYDPQRFSKGQVVSFPMDDHEVPSLPMLFDFVRCVATGICTPRRCTHCHTRLAMLHLRSRQARSCKSSVEWGVISMFVSCIACWTLIPDN